MKLRSLLGLVTTILVLIGMAGTLGCSATGSQVTPLVQSTTETTITSPNTQIAVAVTASGMSVTTQPAAETPAITTATETPVTTTTTWANGMSAAWAASSPAAITHSTAA